MHLNTHCEIKELNCPIIQESEKRISENKNLTKNSIDEKNTESLGLNIIEQQNSECVSIKNIECLISSCSDQKVNNPKKVTFEEKIIANNPNQNSEILPFTKLLGFPTQETPVNLSELIKLNSKSTPKNNENVNDICTDPSNLIRDLTKNNNIKLELFNQNNPDTQSQNRIINQILESAQMNGGKLNIIKDMHDFINNQFNQLNSYNLMNLNNTNFNKLNFSPNVNMSNIFQNQLRNYYNMSPTSDQVRYYNNWLYSNLQNLSQSQNDYIGNTGISPTSPASMSNHFN